MILCIIDCPIRIICLHNLNFVGLLDTLKSVSVYGCICVLSSVALCKVIEASGTI